MGERIEKIKDIFKKDKKLLIILILAIVGILLLLVSELIPDTKSEISKEDSQTMSEYAESMENKLKKIISSIEGAGNTDVMVTVDTSEENVFAKEIKTDEESNENKKSTKYEYEYIVIKSGSNGESGMLLKVIEPNIRGVAIVCDGGDNPAVKEDIINTVSAVLDIKTNKISVCKRKS